MCKGPEINLGPVTASPGKDFTHHRFGYWKVLGPLTGHVSRFNRAALAVQREPKEQSWHGNGLQWRKRKVHTLDLQLR